MSTNPLPKISVITPNYNYARFIAGTLESVLYQDYPHLEYIVIDDGSSDESISIIRRYESRLAHWETGPNQGQYRAIQRGMERATGEILSWLNSDDAYLPGALSIVADIFRRFPQVQWLTTLYPLHWDERGRLVRADQLRGFSRRGFLAGEHLPSPNALSLGYIQQESTFWRRSLWERSGGFDPDFPRAGDFALWARFFEHAALCGVATPLGGFRVHPAQITSRTYAEYYAEATRVLSRYGGAMAGGWRCVAREMAMRFPIRLHPALEKCSLLNRSPVVSWELAAGEWKIEERLI